MDVAIGVKGRGRTGTIVRQDIDLHAVAYLYIYDIIRGLNFRWPLMFTQSGDKPCFPI